MLCEDPQCVDMVYRNLGPRKEKCTEVYFKAVQLLVLCEIPFKWKIGYLWNPAVDRGE